MLITKEFAPITIKINTKQELDDFKDLAKRAMDRDKFFGYPTYRDFKSAGLARKILDL
jgi:hypothetical protein